MSFAPNRTLLQPAAHRMEEELKVCDPVKTDHTRDMESWRVFKIMAELVDGFDLLRRHKLAATFFGSARTTPDQSEYQAAEALAARLSKSGFAVISGGAGGIMEAANKGAFEAGGPSIGMNIRLPQEQAGNGYMTETLNFNYFFTRRVMLAFASEVYIFFPGGFGTLDEFFEIVTLVQTRKIKRIPVVLYGKSFWDPLVVFMRDHLLSRKTIGEDDLDLFKIVDSLDEAYAEILTSVKC